jgi:Kelch motif
LSYIGGVLYLFGGQDEFNEKANDLWRFDLGQKKWTLVQ